jgi:hypothetical protein
MAVFTFGLTQDNTNMYSYFRNNPTKIVDYLKQNPILVSKYLETNPLNIGIDTSIEFPKK